VRSLPHDKSVLEMWGRLLGILAVSTERVAVLPLFQCAGVLDPRGRFGWTLYPATPPAPYRCQDPTASHHRAIGPSGRLTIESPDHRAIGPLADLRLRRQRAAWAG